MEISHLSRLDGIFRTPLKDVVDQTVIARSLGALEIVAFGVAGDGVQRLAGMVRQDLVEALAQGGVIRSDVDLYPLSRVAQAYAALEQGELVGRAVVTPDG